MGLPAWGLAILVVYPLLQIPAVLLIARYCEVDVGDLPTPPTRAFWTDETPEEDDPVASMASGVVRCSNCGEHNDPAFGRCRYCVARL